MNNAALLFLSAGLWTVSKLWESWAEHNEASRRHQQRTQQFSDCGFRVSSHPQADGSQVLRLRGSWEDLLRLNNPDYDSNKPPLPMDLNIDPLPEYNCGCPYCGKMSIHGEQQWRYHELSRTRGKWNNTTTYLVKCMMCDGFMKSTIDHDD